MPWLIGTAFLHSMMVQEKRGMLKVWNVSLIVGDVHARSARHVPGAIRHPRVDPRLRRVDRRRLVPGPDRRRAGRLDRADRLAPRRPALGASDRLAAVARVSLPAQQPGAGRPVLRDLLGHLLPADLRGGHRRQGERRPALVRPLHGAAGDRARAVLRDRAAARLAAGERRLAPAARARAAGRGRRRDRRGGAHRRHRRARCRSSMFSFASFAIAAVASEYGAGPAHAASAERRAAGAALAAVVRATGAATAATSCTSALRC